MKKYKIALGADHAAFHLKNELAAFLKDSGHDVTDMGTHSEASVDYPDFARAVCSAIEDGSHHFGVLCCGSGIGISIAANRHQGIRAGVAWNTDIAALMRQHNDANVICFGARFTAPYYAKRMLEVFLNAEFEGGKHLQRIAKLSC
ncbi:MAG: ribose 5-phosphate isomerase B [Cytophagales bacterium]|nr:ribose 5-phosphate isomerase B [Cytophagales bacterium]MDW8385043.1 ribose 5-phosphate isomerase B [Flammeovirgaceae bacterium]